MNPLQGLSPVGEACGRLIAQTPEYVCMLWAQHTKGLTAPCRSGHAHSHDVNDAGDSSLRVWHYDEGTCAAVLDGHGAEIQAIAITPDDNHIVSVDGCGGVFVWPVPAM